MWCFRHRNQAHQNNANQDNSKQIEAKKSIWISQEILKLPLLWNPPIIFWKGNFRSGKIPPTLLQKNLKKISTLYDYMPQKIWSSNRGEIHLQWCANTYRCPNISQGVQKNTYKCPNISHPNPSISCRILLSPTTGDDVCWCQPSSGDSINGGLGDMKITLTLTTMLVIYRSVTCLLGSFLFSSYDVLNNF